MTKGVQMSKRKILLSSIVIALLALPSYAEEAEDAYEEESSIEISGYAKVESGIYTNKGASKNSTHGHGVGDFNKNEGTLKFFLNGDIGEESSFHSEVQLVKDEYGVTGYSNPRAYTQTELLRELYIDTTVGEVDVRIGKQQVVWGKADGVKFLDIINPTDFREWGQNTMEDSRIPLWMAVVEKDLGNNDSIQAVWVPDINRINQIPGLNNPSNGDVNQPFVSLGADAITGRYNGFLNVGKDMGRVAGAFVQAAAGGAFAPATDLSQITNTTVGGFTSLTSAQTPPAFGGASGAQALDGTIQ